MILTEEEKRKFIQVIEGIDLELLNIPDEANRNWFKFGAYDALRILVEKIVKVEEK